jgi:hypothetical protein
MGASHRNQFVRFREWTTWNGQSASAWTWQPTWELRQEMPWLPVSISRETLDGIELVIDWFLDNIEALRQEHTLTINKQISWN